MTSRERRNNYRITIYKEDTIRMSFKYGEKTVSGGVCNFSRFGCGCYIPATEKEYPGLDQSISDITIITEGQEKNIGSGLIKRIFKEADLRYLGIHLETEFIDFDFFAEENKIYLQQDEQNRIKLFFETIPKTSAEMKNFAANFVFGLSAYKRSFDELDTKFKNESPDMKQSLFNAVLNGVGKDFYYFLDKSIVELYNIAKDFTRKESNYNGFYLRQVTWNYLMESAIIKRSILKPRGYSGDSEMMEMTYNNRYEGDSTFGRLFYTHQMKSDFANAVRYRRELIKNELNTLIAKTDSDLFRAMSVACGPAREIQDFLSQTKYREKFRLVLLDQDQHALNEAHKNIDALGIAGIDNNISYIKDSVRTLLKTSKPDQHYGQFELIYSMGLFDYLTTPVAKAVLSRLYSLVAPGGRLIIGNFYKYEQNVSQIYLEYLLDWVLYYRDEDSLLELTTSLEGNFSTEFHFAKGNRSQIFLFITRHS